MTGLLSLLVTVIIAGLIAYLLFWLLGQIALPAPFDKVAIVLLSLAAVVFLIGLLTGSVPVLKLG